MYSILLSVLTFKTRFITPQPDSVSPMPVPETPVLRADGLTAKYVPPPRSAEFLPFCPFALNISSSSYPSLIFIFCFFYICALNRRLWLRSLFGSVLSALLCDSRFSIIPVRTGYNTLKTVRSPCERRNLAE